MFQSLIGQRVSVVVASRGDNLLEYIGNLVAESDDAIVLTNVDVTFLLSNLQKGLIGGFNTTKLTFKTGIDKIIINKKYIISCDTLQ